MAFASVEFFLLIGILALIYFTISLKYQWVCLLIGSYVFYAYSSIRALPYILTTTCVTFFCAIGIEKIQNKYTLLLGGKEHPLGADEKRVLKERCKSEKKKILLVALLVDLGLLIVIKYGNFVIDNVNSVLASHGGDARISTLSILVPLGISFYTFQSVGYLMDVYRGKVLADKNIFKFALFVSYFPQIVQGPIARYGDLAKQLTASHRFDYMRAKFGAQRMLWGYFKKMVIADRVAVIVNEVFANYATQGYRGWIIWVAGALYSIQVYADFAGGMDIVIGFSEILGIRMTENFRRPFMARSVAEFWQRWHMTLGAWMKDYVFYPLALSKPFNRMGKALRKSGGPYLAKVVPSCLASFIVFVLVGVWHGADWKYVIYGIYQAIFVSTATLLEAFYQKSRKVLRVDDTCVSFRIFQMFRTFTLLVIGRFLSRADTLSNAVGMLKASVAEWNPWVLFDGTLFKLGLGAPDFVLMLMVIVLLLVVDYVQEKGIHIREAIAKQDIVFRWGLYFLVLFSIIVFGMYGHGYNAASFIYQGF